MKHTAEEIAKALDLDLDGILNIYCYGSRVYGTDDEESDSDYIIVHKSATISNSYNSNLSFKNNAISSDDGEIQGIRYSRTGFLDAIDKYDISAWECLFLNESSVIKSKWPYGVRKYNEKEMVKKVITKASDSWFLVKRHIDNDRFEQAEKGVFHAIRILMYGLQIKQRQKIVDYSEATTFGMNY